MATFEIVRAEFADGPHYTFLVDGAPSLKWFRECTVLGLPKTYYVDRCVARLKAGRSREAFGDAPEVRLDGRALDPGAAPDRDRIAAALRSQGLGEGRVGHVLRTLSAGGGVHRGRGGLHREEPEPAPASEGAPATRSGKPSPSRPAWRYVLDGRRSTQSYPTEQSARAACAVAAFMSRGKLGRLAEAQGALEAAYPDRPCKVWACAKEHCVRAKVDGAEYLIRWEPDGSFKFKPKGE